MTDTGCDGYGAAQGLCRILSAVARQESPVAIAANLGKLKRMCGEKESAIRGRRNNTWTRATKEIRKWRLGLSSCLPRYWP